MDKIEHWKRRGAGPWIVLRLEPSKSNEDTDLRLAEIVYRPIKGGEIIQSRISPELWKRYNGYRAITIFMLLAAAKRTASINPDDEVSIIATPLRPSWPNTFCELIQKKKFENSVWLQKFFGITPSQKFQPKSGIDTTVENGLARVARSSGRTGKKTEIQSEMERILGDPDAPKIKLFLKASYLNPKSIFIIKGLNADPTDQGLTSSKDLLKLAQLLESVESDWWKTLSEDIHTRKPAPNETRGTQVIQKVATTPIELGTNAAVSNNSLFQYIKELPIPSILSHILSILESVDNTGDLKKLMADFESPVLVHAMAEKLSIESIDDFSLFFRDTITLLEPFKLRVAKDLAVNQVLRKKLAATVAKAGFRDMLAWFNVFSKYCDHAIILDLEQELIAVAKEVDFKDKFLIFAPNRLPSLINHFSRSGCVVAVQIFEKINEEAKAYDKNVNRILYGKRIADKE